MTAPVDWPRRWGTSWMIAASVFVAVAVGVWLAGYHHLATAISVAALACYSRATYWRGYRHARDSAPKPGSPS